MWYSKILVENCTDFWPTPPVHCSTFGLTLFDFRQDLWPQETTQRAIVHLYLPDPILHLLVGRIPTCVWQTDGYTIHVYHMIASQHEIRRYWRYAVMEPPDCNVLGAFTGLNPALSINNAGLLSCCPHSDTINTKYCYSRSNTLRFNKIVPIINGVW